MLQLSGGRRVARGGRWHVAGARPRWIDLDGPVTLTLTFTVTLAFTHTLATLTLSPTLTLKGLKLALKLAFKPTLTSTASARRKGCARSLSVSKARAV